VSGPGQVSGPPDRADHPRRTGARALGDGVGQCLGAKLSLILIGGRPGLSVVESLGIYLTWAPRLGRSDAECNCISNIHGDRLTYRGAAGKLVWLIDDATQHSLTGVQLRTNGSILSRPRCPITVRPRLADGARLAAGSRSHPALAESYVATLVSRRASVMRGSVMRSCRPVYPLDRHDDVLRGPVRTNILGLWFRAHHGPLRSSPATSRWGSSALRRLPGGPSRCSAWGP
jgi:hypothetical protein